MSAEPMAVLVARRALDGLTMRMAAIAQNIANANSPRFQSVSVDFEDSLRAAASRGPAAVASASFEFRADHAFAPGEDRRMDLMIADAAQTAMRYSALVDMIGRRLSISQVAAGGQG